MTKADMDFDLNALTGSHNTTLVMDVGFGVHLVLKTDEYAFLTLYERDCKGDSIVHIVDSLDTSPDDCFILKVGICWGSVVSSVKYEAILSYWYE